MSEWDVYPANMSKPHVIVTSQLVFYFATMFSSLTLFSQKILGAIFFCFVLLFLHGFSLAARLWLCPINSCTALTSKLKVCAITARSSKKNINEQIEQMRHIGKIYVTQNCTSMVKKCTVEYGITYVYCFYLFEMNVPCKIETHRYKTIETVRVHSTCCRGCVADSIWIARKRWWLFLKRRTMCAATAAIIVAAVGIDDDVLINVLARMSKYYYLRAFAVLTLSKPSYDSEIVEQRCEAVCSNFTKKIAKKKCCTKEAAATVRTLI